MPRVSSTVRKDAWNIPIRQFTDCFFLTWVWIWTGESPFDYCTVKKRDIFRNGKCVLEIATPQEGVQPLLKARKHLLIPFSLCSSQPKTRHSRFSEMVSNIQHPAGAFAFTRCVGTFQPFSSLSSSSFNIRIIVATRAITARFSPRLTSSIDNSDFVCRKDLVSDLIDDLEPHSSSLFTLSHASMQIFHTW